jgi:hypothetical protein
MTQTPRSLLATRLAKANEHLREALSRGDSFSVVEEREHEVNVLVGINARLIADRPKWTGPAVVAGLALLLIALGLLIHVPAAVGLDAKVSELTLISAPSEGGIALTKPLAATHFQIVGDSHLPSYQEEVDLQSMAILPATNVRFTRDESGCYSAITAPPNGGVDLTFLEQKNSANTTEGVRSIRVHPGSQIYFCVKGDVVPIYAGSVSFLEIAKIYRLGTPRITLSSIESGILQIGQTGRELKLDDHVRFVFSKIENGWIVMEPGKDLRIVFSGSSVSTRKLGISSVENENLAPNLVDILTSSTKTKALFGAIAGLVGIIWSIWRYFGFS